MIEVGYFTQADIKVSTTFIYDLIKGLKANQDLEVSCFNGGLDKNTSFNSKSIGFNKKYERWIYRLSHFSILFGRSKESFILWVKQALTFRLLSQNIDKKFDVAYVDFSTTAVLLMHYFRKNKVPFIVHVHGYDITSELNNKAYHTELTKLFDCADKFIAASQYMKRRLILLGCDASKINVINLGVESSNIKLMDWDDKRKIEPSIIFLGRLTPKKSPIALIHSFKIVKDNIPSAQLSIIGDGPLKSEVEKLIKILNLEKSVRFYGALNREDSFPIMRKHWVYAQHSVTPISGDTEGFAISLAEAALHELPVVSTIHNGITENVIDGVTGFLVPEYDYEQMAEKIIELMQDANLAARMGKAGRNHVLNSFQPKVRIELIKNLLFEVSNKE